MKWSERRAGISSAIPNSIRAKYTISTSRSVSFDSQSLFKVSTQTLPVDSSTFGCQIFVRKDALGGLLG